MSPAIWRGAKLALILFVAALLQSVGADACRLWGARPDLLLTCALIGALYCTGTAGMMLGFGAGILLASLASPPKAGFGSLIVSRTLVCAGVGWLEERMFRDSVQIAVAAVLGGTLLVETLFFLFAPQSDLPHWIRGVVGTCLYNTLLAAPIYKVIRGVLGQHGHKEPIL